MASGESAAIARVEEAGFHKQRLNFSGAGVVWVPVFSVNASRWV